MFAIVFGDLNLDSVAVKIGPLAIRWYALSYIAGLIIGWIYCRYLTRRPPHTVSKQQIDDFARNRGLPFFALADIVACATPIGLFLGRLANFVNGELFGRRTGTDWGIVFPGGGPDPRHPSQLYEALLEGIVLFAVMFLLVRFTHAKSKLGVLSGAFLVGYGLCRIIAELFREPDPQLRFLVDILGGATMGQLLSVPMLIMGALFILWAKPAVK
jgi:phosphatidylglycerol:prolipoprotein diacylglycerol transferase